MNLRPWLNPYGSRLALLLSLSLIPLLEAEDVAKGCPPEVSSAPAKQVHEILLIDAVVPEAAKLAALARPGMEIVVLDPQRNELAQIGAALEGRRGLTAVHLVSHGAPGALVLGGRQIDVATLHRFVPSREAGLNRPCSVSFRL